MMEYKRYLCKVEFDDDASLFHGEVINTRDVITFQGQSVAELERAFRESVDDYLAFCAARGEEPEKPGEAVPPISDEWRTELERRSAEFDAGLVKPIPWEQVNKKTFRGNP